MNTTSKDIVASLVVFIVALPLCLGVAIGSHVPPVLGLISGIIGGIVVGTFGGSPLQVSGPAAGLIASVLIIVSGWGVPALGYAVLIAGSIQIIAALLKLGRWFRAVSPAVIGGMLAGIGVIIAAGQIHVMVDRDPPKGGIPSIAEAPHAWIEAVGGNGFYAALIGLATIVILFSWDKFKPAKLAIIPGALVAVLAATILSVVFALPIARVDIPEKLLSSLNFPQLSDASTLLTDVSFWGAALALGLVAAAETLLCASATDELHGGARTNYDKELFGLGLGNFVAGIFGALPVTGVIVRSSANIEAGAQTKRSTILHGLLLLVAIALIPAVMELIPIASLAGVLVFVGFKLIAPQKIAELFRTKRGEFWVFAITVCSIVVFGLLPGIAIGFAVALLKIVYTFSHIEVDVERNGTRWDVDVHGAATFIALPKLAAALESIPERDEVHVHLGGLSYVDHACAELLQSQAERHERAGGIFVTEWDELHRLGDKKPLVQRDSEPVDLGQSSSRRWLEPRLERGPAR